MPRTWALALLAACATEREDVSRPSPAPTPKEAVAARPDDDVAEDLRRFIAEHWSEALARGVEFPDVPDLAVKRLEAEEYSPGESGRYYFIQEHYDFLVLVARGGTVDVTLVECGDRPSLMSGRYSWPSRPVQPVRYVVPGAWDLVQARAWRATIPSAELERLVRKVALLQGATAGRHGTPAEEESKDVRVETCSVRLDGHPPIEARRSECDTSTFGHDARAAVISLLVWTAARQWSYEEVEDPDTIGRALVGDLATMPISWRRPARIKMLGLLGCAAAIPVLEKLEPCGEDIDEALTQIRLLQECKGARAAPPSLVDVAVDRGRDTNWRLWPWALETLAQRFPGDYRAWLHRRFETEDREERADVLEELHKYDASDPTLARRACNDPDPALRVRGAVLLRDRTLLLTLARDPAFPPDERIRCAVFLGDEAVLLGMAGDPAFPPEERVRAILALTGSDEAVAKPARDREAVGEALVALLEDPADGLRKAATEGLVALRFDDAIPVLIRAMLAALSERRGGEAADFACALGALGANDAVEPIDRALQGEAPSTFCYRACFGLAAIDDPRVLPILKRERENHRRDPRGYENWNRSLATHILEGGKRSGRDVSGDIAGEFTVDELRAFAEDPTLAQHRRVLMRALALKKGPG